jgi:hypothetical protein
MDAAITFFSHEVFTNNSLTKWLFTVQGFMVKGLEEVLAISVKHRGAEDTEDTEVHRVGMRSLPQIGKISAFITKQGERELSSLKNLFEC